MKIKNYIIAYASKNLGDDLFIKILCDRYKHEKFIINCNENYLGIKNLRAIKTYRLLRAIARAISLGNKSINNYFASVAEKTILIGGSMFIERPQTTKINHALSNAKKVFIIGANFGPFISRGYYDYFSNIFSRAEDVCFRDQYSYSLFSELPNTRVAPDIIFSMEIPKFKNVGHHQKKVAISVIDCRNRDISKYTDIYENKIVEMINYFYGIGYEICLMSFCKKEGDENAIQSILGKITNERIKLSICKYCYDGNIKSAIEALNNCDIIVGTRFHANILGLILNKTIIPIAYSEKTINSLKDIKFGGKIIKLQEIEHFNINDLSDKELNYKLDVSKYKKEAEAHFKELDKVLKR